jgi:hypothetical protein
VTATTYTARQTAREVSKRLGREVSDKRVRAWVRDNLDAYDDDQYTAHVYSHATYQRIVTAMVAKGRAGRAQAAATGRTGTGTPRKPSTPRKPASVAPSAPSATVAPDATGDATA